MPLYRTSTGSIVERSERYVLAYPPGKYTLVGPTNTERVQAELREAEEKKVDLEDLVPDEDPVPIKKGHK